MRTKRIRDTSRDAYDNLKEILTEKRWQVYRTLYGRGPMTAQELFKAVGCDTNQSGRFTELRDMGLIQELGTKKCPVTGNTAIEWDVTSLDDPITPEKKPSRLKELEEALVKEADLTMELQAENRELKREIARLNGLLL